MEKIRGSSQAEFARWYLARERRKGNTDTYPSDPDEAIRAMQERHVGKWRDWFDGAVWSIATLDQADLRELVFLESDWTKEEGLVFREGSDYRLLDRVARRAIDGGYLDRPSAVRHVDHYERLSRGLRLAGEERIAICSAEPSEKAANPSGRFYLLDGVGRGLAYAILLEEGRVSLEPVEAFVAERASNDRNDRSDGTDRDSSGSDPASLLA